MTKPTGRPRGRPKTKEYITLMARVPQDLAERVQRYAGRKRQTVSDVLRDGLLVLLEEEDPYRAFTSDRNAAGDILSDVKETIPVTLSDNKGDNRQDQPSFLYDMNTDNPPITSDKKAANASIVSDKKAVPAKASDRKRARAAIVSDINEPSDNASDTIPPFDPEKFILGKLCPRAHEYHGTGQTLLKRSNRHCMACDREKFHERKQAQRAK